MDPEIESALLWFKRIYLDGIPALLRAGETAFLSFLCVVAATDALAAYRYPTNRVGDRFEDFVKNYFPPEYAPHAANLYLFRCRMLHNFSPAHFTLVHASPGTHLKASSIGDTVLSDDSFFAHMQLAAERYFAELRASAVLQRDMLARLRDVNRGGAIGVTS
jgi:hypothetical protein